MYHKPLIVNYGNAAIYGFVPVSNADKQNYLGYDDCVSVSYVKTTNKFSKVISFPTLEKLSLILRCGPDWLHDAFTFSTDGVPHLSMKHLNSSNYCDFGIESHDVFYTTKPLRIQKYSTSDRPTLDASQIGVQIFDSTINRPIWWNGSAWVDATGATV